MRRGGYCLPSTGNGTASTSGLPDGVRGGIWERMHQHFIDDPDMEYLIIDSTVVRAHHSLRALPKKRWSSISSPRSQPRWVHYKGPCRCRRPRQPVEIQIERRQEHDVTQAEALISGMESEYVIADRAYDSRQFRESIIGNGTTPVIPPRSNRRELPSYDKYLYRERHLVECFIGKIKHYRHIFSRFDKLANRYLGFLHFVGALIWLR